MGLLGNLGLPLLPAAGGGSVAAGDITDAGPTGVALVQAETAAEALAELGARGALPSAGWTDVVTGTATVAHAAGVHTLSVGSGERAEAHYPAPSTAECPALELLARIDVTTGAPGTDWWAAIELRSEDGADAIITQVSLAGAVQAWRVLSTTVTMLASTGAVDLTTGNTYLRLVVTPSLAAYFFGTGVGDALPTSWTKVHQVAVDVGQYARGALTRVGVRVGRTASGSGTYTTEFRAVQVRVLGLAP